MSVSTWEKTIVRWKNDSNVPIESIIILRFMSHGNFESWKLASLLQDRDITVKVSNLKSTGYDPRMGIIPYGAYNPSNAKLVTAASGYPSNYEHYSNFEPKALAQSKPKLTGQSYNHLIKHSNRDLILWFNLRPALVRWSLKSTSVWGAAYDIIIHIESLLRITVLKGSITYTFRGQYGRCKYLWNQEFVQWNVFLPNPQYFR